MLEATWLRRRGLSSPMLVVDVLINKRSAVSSSEHRLIGRMRCPIMRVASVDRSIFSSHSGAGADGFAPPFGGRGGNGAHAVIAATAADVVKIFPLMRVTASSPRRTAVRSEVNLSGPWGNRISTASGNVINSSGAQEPGSGRPKDLLLAIPILRPRARLDGRVDNVWH